MQIWRTRVGNDFYPLIRLLLPDVSFLGRATLTSA